MYKPQGNAVLIKTDTATLTPLLAAGVVRGTVVGVGDGEVLKDGTTVRPSVEVGQKVHFDLEGAEKFQLSGIEYLVVKMEKVKIIELTPPLDIRTSQKHEFAARRMVVLAEAPDGTVREVCKDVGPNTYRVYYEA